MYDIFLLRITCVSTIGHQNMAGRSLLSAFKHVFKYPQLAHHRIAKIKTYATPTHHNNKPQREHFTKNYHFKPT